MGQAHLEQSFLNLHRTANATSSTSLPRPRLDRRRSISKIKPEMVKSVIANATTKYDPDNALNSSPATPTPPHLPFLGEGRYEKTPGTAPFTIFYNGTLSVFDLTDDMAQGLIKFAMEKSWGVKLRVNHIHTSSNAPAQDILQQLNQGG